MTLQQLIKYIENANYLNETQKKLWLRMIPKMSVEHLEKLASIINWAEVKSENLSKKKDSAVIAMAEVLKAINTFANKKAKKSVLLYKENKSEEEDNSNLDSLMENLNLT